MPAAEPPSELRRVPLRKRLLWGGAGGIIGAGLVFALTYTQLFTSFESRTLDLRQRVFAKPTPAVDRVAVVLIDDFSIEQAAEDLITFPWQRDVYEAMVLFLKEAGARCIVFDMIFADSWPERKFDEVFAEAAKTAGSVVFAAKLGSRPPKPEKEAAAIEKARVAVEGWAFPPRKETTNLIPPIKELTAAARAVGFVNVVQDPDNTIRRADLLSAYPDPGTVLGFLGFQAARSVLGWDAKGAVTGRELVFGERRIPLGVDGRMLIHYYGKEQTFFTENAWAVIQGRADPARFKDRVVIIGVNAAGIEDIVTAPVSAILPGSELMATVCANLIGGDFLAEPGQVARAALLAGIGLLAGLALFAVWKPVLATAAAAGLVALQSAAAFLAFRQGLVIDLFFPAALMVLLYAAALLAGYLTEGRQKREVSRAFGQYLSPVVIRDLLRNPEALKLGGETRDIAVYFSDIQGFSTFSEGMSAAELVAFLNLYLTAMSEPILDRRGVIDKYIGDAIMAFWGAPLAIERPALEACLAVTEQRRALARLNERFRAEGRPVLKFRAGMNLGQATVGNMGSTQRFDYTAMGDTVNLASRLEGANKFFGSNVMMTEEVFRGAGDGIVARRLGRILVVGKTHPAAVYELLGRAGEVSGAEMERLARYHEALELLESGAAREAAARFEALLRESPDPVIEVCRRKCDEVEKTGSWDGVWTLTSKG